MRFSILFGGRSFEHEVSIVSAISVSKALDMDLGFIFCDINGELFLIDKKNLNAKFFSSGKYKTSKKLYLTKNGFYKKTIFGSRGVDLGIVINLIHGKDGEDGTFSGLFGFLDIPFVGVRMEASVLSFNKALTKSFAQKIGVKTLEYEIITRESKAIKMSLPVIIKPLRLGSSIGVSVVKEQKHLDYALDLAFEFDDEILVEKFVENVQEFNLAGAWGDERMHYSMIESVKKQEMLDFKQKYLDFSRTKSKPADLSPELEQKFHDAFNKIYFPLFKGALIRCDFFLLGDEVYLNEINPHPGSLANYLFDDFQSVLESLANSLPYVKPIATNYAYIHSINTAKGK